jgi:TIR domain
VADLSVADLSGALCWRTVFADVDLSKAKGLDSVIHHGPSTIGTDTLFLSEGKLPEAFLRGCGVPDALISYLPSLISSMSPIQFYSSFISYSAKDTPFAERLYADLQSKGVRCWYAPEDLKIREKIRVGIDQSIRVHEKLLLILSRYSVKSEWVEKEVETAMERERRENRIVLFPIRPDDAVMKIENGWPADVRRSRNIGDFRGWKTHDTYQKSIDRLVRDLKAEESANPAAKWTCAQLGRLVKEETPSTKVVSANTPVKGVSP